MSVTTCNSVETWHNYLQRSKERPVVVFFAAAWSGPCRFIAPFFTELAKKHTNVQFLKVDVDELKSVAIDWNVEAVPTFVLVKDCKTVEKVVGAKKV